jgi:SAM-dependent methyltransferase
MPVDFRKDKRYAHLTLEQVRAIYEEERELARYLLSVPPEERTNAFLWAYDELFRRCPWHPAMGEVRSPQDEKLIERRVSGILPFLGCPIGSHILEVGCGWGELVIGLGRRGYNCVGIDVSETRIGALRAFEGPNIRFERCEGTTLPFSFGEFDAVLSIQLFEHLHPEDALPHLVEVCRVLKGGGRYLLETPNRLSGPHDVSRFFSDTAEGFHLREYSIADMVRLLRQGGFRVIQVVLRRRHIVNDKTALLMEKLWGLLPRAVRRRRSFGLHNPLYVAMK